MSRRVTWDKIFLEPSIGTDILDAADAAYDFSNLIEYDYTEVYLKFNDILIKVRDKFLDHNKVLKTKTLRPAEIVRIYDKNLADLRCDSD